MPLKTHETTKIRRVNLFDLNGVDQITILGRVSIVHKKKDKRLMKQTALANKKTITNYNKLIWSRIIKIHLTYFLMKIEI